MIKYMDIDLTKFDNKEEEIILEEIPVVNQPANVPADPPKISLPPDDAKELDDLKLILRLYKQHLTSIVPFDADIDSLSLTEARDLKSRLDAQFTSETMVNEMTSGFLNSLKIVEAIASKYGVLLNGFSDVCAGNQTIVADLNFIFINLFRRFKMSPYIRLPINLFRTGAIVHQYNSALLAKDTEQKIVEQKPDIQIKNNPTMIEPVTIRMDIPNPRIANINK